ncbi:MAG: cyclase family protein [Desulfobacterales bacterium]|nr:cyclase family protein [Desulfobacterales bacterium]
MKIIDISVPLSPHLPVWPGDRQIVLERYHALSRGDTSNDTRLVCSVHSGTHVDAPLHFVENGASVEQLPLDVLMGPAVVVELPEIDVITPEQLDAQELPPSTQRLLLKTKNSRLWDHPDHKFNPEFVALSAASADWMVDQGIRLVGIDYLSIQLYDDVEPQTHRTLLDAGIIILEGLDLRQVRSGRYDLICLPLKLAGSEGAPARAVLIEK